MFASHKRLSVIAATCACCLGFGLVAAQDQPTPDAAKAKDTVARWLARNRIMEVIGDEGVKTLKKASTGQDLVSRRSDTQVEELRRQHALENWRPAESEELTAMLAVVGEFLQVLEDVRDEVRAYEKKKKTKPSPGGKRAGPDLPGPPSGGPVIELEKYRGDVFKQGDLFVRNLLNNDAEAAIKRTWKLIQDEALKVHDRTMPALVADEYVASEFERRMLIQSWSRTDYKEEPGVQVRGSTKVQMVSYKIVDAYGTPRRGKIAVAFRGAGSSSGKWEVVSENRDRGGFYELVKAED